MKHHFLGKLVDKLELHVCRDGKKKEIEIMASFGTRFIFGCILIILKQYAVHIDQDKKHIGFFVRILVLGFFFNIWWNYSFY